MEDNQHLLGLISASDELSYKAIYEMHESYWFRLCLRYARNRDEAQDIFQEGVLKVFHSLRLFNAQRGLFKNWSSKIMVNAALKYLKNQQWQDSFKDMEASTEVSEWTDNHYEHLTAKELTEMIQKLPLGYRLVFNMFELEGYSHPEIAQELNISIGTSKSQLFKAKKLLQEKFVKSF
jgi:RNA polymerase sigma factor (sigma-70 family)